MAFFITDCFRNCLKSSFKADKIEESILNPIILDTNFMGHDVVVIKDGLRACGSGGVLCNAPLVQDKAYFEIKIQQSGIWSVGLATRNCNLNETTGGEDSESWVFCHDGVYRHNKREIQRIEKYPVEGDIVCVSYDHIELNFYINGTPLNAPITGIRGTVFPAIYVDDGAIIDVIFDNFICIPPNGFQKIMLEQSLL